MGLLLAIDTSGRAAGVALLDGEQVLAERTWTARINHTVQVLPVTQELLRSQGRAPAELTAVGVALGPGGFTGLRVGIATAKALAWSLAIPCLGIGSLEALAATASWSTRVLAVLDAGRGDWYWAGYANERGRHRQVTPPQIGAPEAVLGALTRATFLVGDTTPEQRELIATRFRRLVEQGDPRLPAARPAALGLLAVARLAAGEPDEPAALQPLYIRRPATEERKGATP